MKYYGEWKGLEEIDGLSCEMDFSKITDLKRQNNREETGEKNT